MKTLKKVFAVGLVAAFASAGFAVQAGADHTEPRLTLAIDPSQGLPGQTINAQVPDEYKTECSGVGNPINDLLSAALQTIITEDPDPVVQTAAGILAGGLADPETQGILESVLFLLLFVDPATEEPLSEPGQDFWDQNTGQGSIVAPGTDENPDSPNFGQPLPRPATYFVVAVCLGLIDITPEALAALVQAAAEQLAALIEELVGDVLMGPLGAFLGCVAAIPTTGNTLADCAEAAGLTPEDAEAAQAELEAEIAAILGGLIEGLIDTDPEVAWVAPFCLLGGNGQVEDCAVPEAPPVPAAPTFAG